MLRISLDGLVLLEWINSCTHCSTLRRRHYNNSLRGNKGYVLTHGAASSGVPCLDGSVAERPDSMSDPWLTIEEHF